MNEAKATLATGRSTAGSTANPPNAGELADPARLATDAASFVSALRRLDTTYAPRAVRGVHLTEQDDATRDAISRLHGRVHTETIVAAWNDALTLAPWTAAPVWIHGDPRPDNLLCLQGRLHAVIDFGGLGIGDPAADMLLAWTLLRPAARNTYRAASGVDAGTWTRGRAWALSTALIQLPYYQHTNRQLAASARHVIAQVLNDLRTDA